MTSLLIRNVDEALHKRLKASASSHRRSLEEEVRELLRLAIARQDGAPREHIVDATRRLFGPEHGFDLDLPPRGSSPQSVPPDFTDGAFGPDDPDPGAKPRQTR